MAHGQKVTAGRTTEHASQGLQYLTARCAGAGTERGRCGGGADVRGGAEAGEKGGGGGLGRRAQHFQLGLLERLQRPLPGWVNVPTKSDRNSQCSLCQSLQDLTAVSAAHTHHLHPRSSLDTLVALKLCIQKEVMSAQGTQRQWTAWRQLTTPPSPLGPQTASSASSAFRQVLCPLARFGLPSDGSAVPIMQHHPTRDAVVSERNGHGVGLQRQRHCIPRQHRESIANVPSD